MTRKPTSRPITHIRDVLDEIVRTCRKESDAEILEIRSLWETILTKTVTEYAQPVSLKDGILWVHVKSPALIHQLRFQANNIITRLNQGMEQPKVHEIKCKIAAF